MMGSYLKRFLEDKVLQADRQFPVLMLTGARQVGKTTLLSQLAGPPRSYVTLDDPLALALAREDPALFLQRFRPPLLIDEVQYAPNLLPHLKLAVDRDRRPGMYWLTGSQPFHLMQGVSESLAGRVAVLELRGLVRREIAGLPASEGPFLPLPASVDARLASATPLDLGALYHAIWRGVMPGLTLEPGVDRDLFYASYVQTYLQRDVRALARVGDELAFLRFLRAVAARTAQLLNMADLARDADIAPNTAKAWLGILTSSGVVGLLEPYHLNPTKRLVKAPKLYCLDTGLCAYLTEWSSPATLEAGAMSGAMLETWAVAELQAGYTNRGIRPPLYHYRDRDRREIDVLIVRDGVIHPLEIKKTAAPASDDIRHFRALDALQAPIGPGGVLCLTERRMPISELHAAIPLAAL